MFWPCIAAASYWGLFSILLFLQSYPSCNFIWMALNRLIHLVVNQLSPFLTAGIDYSTLFLLNYFAYLNVPKQFSHSGIAPVSL